MSRPFLPQTPSGRIACWMSLAAAASFVVAGFLPMVLQQVFGYAAVSNEPGLAELPAWWSAVVGPVFSVSVLLVSVVSGIWAAVAKFRFRDAGVALWLAMIPLLLVVFLLVGEFFIPPFD